MATSLVGTGKMVGAEVRRVEDPRVLLGKSRYVDDVQLPGTVAMAFVRSPYAHAKITRVDVSAAKATPRSTGSAQRCGHRQRNSTITS